MEKRFILRYISDILIIFLIVFLILSFGALVFSAIKIAFAITAVLFLPGFFLSFAFYDKKDATNLERFILSFVLSIIFYPLIVYLLSLVGLAINLLSLFYAFGIIILASLVIFLIKKIRR